VHIAGWNKMVSEGWKTGARISQIPRLTGRQFGDKNISGPSLSKSVAKQSTLKDLGVCHSSGGDSNLQFTGVIFKGEGEVQGGYWQDCGYASYLDLVRSISDRIEQVKSGGNPCTRR